MTGRQPATEPAGSHRADDVYPVRTGAETRVPWSRRLGSGTALVVLSVGLGVAVAVVVAAVVVVVGVLVSSAVN